VTSQHVEAPANSDSSSATSDASVESESSSDEDDVIISDALQSPSKLNDSVPANSPLPHDITALEGASVLRRSLRKIIEESKKDAVCDSSRDSSPCTKTRGISAKQALLGSVSQSQRSVNSGRKNKTLQDVETNSAVKIEAFKEITKSESLSKGKIDSKRDINNVLDVDMETVDSSEQSSVSSLGVLKQSRRNIGKRFVADVEWSSLLGESETNSVDSEVTGLELNRYFKQQTDVSNIGTPVISNTVTPVNSTPVKNNGVTVQLNKDKADSKVDHDTWCANSHDIDQSTKNVTCLKQVDLKIDTIIKHDVTLKIENEGDKCDVKMRDIIASIDTKSSNVSMSCTLVEHEAMSTVSCETEVKDVNEPLKNVSDVKYETVDTVSSEKLSGRDKDEKLDLSPWDEYDKMDEIASGVLESEVVKVKEEPPEILVCCL